MDFEIPLNRLKFGQEDGAGTNARVTGRQDGIAELAANIHANGQIENLVVRRCGEDPRLPVPDGWKGARDMYSVSNGNRRLAAFHMIHSETSTHLVRVTAHDVDENVAFEQSLTTAVTAKQLHPVDQYEAFARLRDKAGKLNEEIAREYGMSDREVEQALALGHLSPKVRDLWRKGEIKTDVAKALTNAPDHKAQDDILAAYAERSGGIAGIEDHDVKASLKIGNDESGTLVEFVGIDAYVARGGKVTRDLFGTDHNVSDPKLVKTMAAERLKAECAKLVESGWSFAVTADSVRTTRHDYTSLKVDASPAPEEMTKLAELNAVFNPNNEINSGYYACDSFAELTGAQQSAYLEYQELERAIQLRTYTPKMMASAGCFVSVDDDGFLEIEFGRVKPKQKEAAAKVVKEEKKEKAKAAATQAKAEGKPAPETTTISNALKERLEMTLVAATRDAILGEPLLASSPLFDILARVACAQIVADRAWGTPDAVRTKLPSIRQALNAGVFNKALAERFDAKDYFGSAPKALVVKAIAEAINPDEARKASTGQGTTADLRQFGLVNLAKTGWLPKELRTVHYAGPGSEGYKKPTRSTPLPDEKTTVLPPKAAGKAKPPAKAIPAKRPAAPKRAAKKTAPKKKIAKKKR